MKKTGKLVSLVYNPTAGEGEHSKEAIISLLNDHGYDCNFSSSKKKLLKAIDPETEFIAIAGGDGTIRKTIIRLLDKKVKYKRPIALLPFGTANNIASALKIHEDTKKNIASWAKYQMRPFDVGRVIGLRKEAHFIESFGFGLFPKLMKVLKKADTSQNNSPEDEFEMALKKLLEITETYNPVKCKIELNDEVIEDECILVEVMNINSLGPQLKLSPNADPGDGFFDVVVVSGKQRQQMIDYVTKKTELKNPVFPIKAIRTKELKITWKGKDVHVDDEVSKIYETNTFKISLLDSLLQILTTQRKNV